MDSSWFWILGFVGLMFVMHRFGLGCCGGHSHGDHSGHQHGPEKERPLEKASEPGKQANPVMASAGGSGMGMACCGGHAHGEQPEGAVRQNAESPPRKADAGGEERKV